AMRACACGLRRIAACAMPGRTTSPTNAPSPWTSRSSSRLRTLWPMYGIALLDQVAIELARGRRAFEPRALHDLERHAPVLFGHPPDWLAARRVARHVLEHHRQAELRELAVGLGVRLHQRRHASLRIGHRVLPPAHRGAQEPLYQIGLLGEC